MPLLPLALTPAVPLPLRLLDSGWEMAAVPANAAADPDALAALDPAWQPATVPGTASAQGRPGGASDLAAWPALDDRDVWFRCRFDVAAAQPGQRRSLAFDGIATLAQMWLNGTPLLAASDNMFHAHLLDADALLVEGSNTLLIRCASVAAALQARRPRPRWRTRLVDQQQLRWIRTSLVGRMPGWTPAAPAIGPWRPVALATHDGARWHTLDVQAALDDAGTGTVRLQGCLELNDARQPTAHLIVGDTTVSLDIQPLPDGQWHIAGRCTVPSPALWWPHTHGEPALYAVTLTVDDTTGHWRFDVGRTGFRRIALATADDGFALSVNGVPVFCRGACWTPADLLALPGPAPDLRARLLQARDAGMNMLRVGGTMAYESDTFHALCDELGILVWQDWMFANMDYPADDALFAASVETEARQFLQRTALSPSLALLCGNSEVEQQAGMVGADPAIWRSTLFADRLPAIGREMRPDVPYWPSSPAGGVLPFQVDAGVAHYFGVGAYLQPVTDARRSGLRFASECLAFAHIPEPDNLERLTPAGAAPPGHPAWKARVPRDGGAAWDFDDVRDHYLESLFGVQPDLLRRTEPERYMALGRVATGETMLAAFREWRRSGSACAGALVWFLQDLQAGAGWGVVDADGHPKAAWYYLQRAMAPVALFMTDEGLNGLALHAVNDRPQSRAAVLSLCLLRRDGLRVAEGRREIVLPAHGARALRGDDLLGRFTDSTCRYLFGPPGHDLAWAELCDATTGELLACDAYFPAGHGLPVQPSIGLAVHAGTPQADGTVVLDIRTTAFAQAVRIEAAGFRADRNYFHLPPGGAATVRLRPLHAVRRPQVLVEALNAAEAVRLPLPAAPAAAA